MDGWIDRYAYIEISLGIQMPMEIHPWISIIIPHQPDRCGKSNVIKHQ
jgi:hypothetical protein